MKVIKNEKNNITIQFTRKEFETITTALFEYSEVCQADKSFEKLHDKISQKVLNSEASKKRK